MAMGGYDKTKAQAELPTTKVHAYCWKIWQDITEAFTFISVDHQWFRPIFISQIHKPC
jgi:hypothetical protein